MVSRWCWLRNRTLADRGAPLQLLEITSVSAYPIADASDREWREQEHHAPTWRAGGFRARSCLARSSVRTASGKDSKCLRQKLLLARLPCSLQFGTGHRMCLLLGREAASRTDVSRGTPSSPGSPRSSCSCRVK